MKTKILIYILILFSFIIYGTEAQIIETKATIDTNNVLIGDQLHYSITAKVSPGTKIIFPNVKDSIGAIEFLDTYKTDTLSQNGKIILRKKYLITCFDSGEFTIPPLPVLIKQKSANSIDTTFSNPVRIRFLSVKVDTTKPIKDIKPIMEEPFTFWDYLPYIIIVLAVIGLIILGFWLWKKYYKKKERTELDYDPSIPPHILAKEALLQLQHEKLWQKGEIKLYHSRLTDILRTYIERKYEFAAMEMTTSEILNELENRKFDKELSSALKKILELADLVKFAKYHPLPDENATSMTLALNFVELTAPADMNPPDKKEENDVQ